MLRSLATKIDPLPVFCLLSFALSGWLVTFLLISRAKFKPQTFLLRNCIATKELLVTYRLKATEKNVFSKRRETKNGHGCDKIVRLPYFGIVPNLSADWEVLQFYLFLG